MGGQLASKSMSKELTKVTHHINHEVYGSLFQAFPILTIRQLLYNIFPPFKTMHSHVELAKLRWLSSACKPRLDHVDSFMIVARAPERENSQSIAGEANFTEFIAKIGKSHSLRILNPNQTVFPAGS